MLIGGGLRADESGIAWGFFIFGLALILPRAWAMRKWPHVRAMIVDRKGGGGDDPPTLKFAYEWEGRRLEGTFSETTNLKAGRGVLLHVNPWQPEEVYHITVTPQIIGWGFIVLGAIGGLFAQAG